MSDEFSIFDNAASTERGEFFKFVTAGDKISGTYIEVFDNIDGFNNEQRVYVLKDSDGKIWNVGIKKWNRGILETMEKQRLGQIIGFTYVGDKESKKSHRMFKDIKVSADARFYDKAWLQQQQDIVKAFEGLPKPSEVVPGKVDNLQNDVDAAPLQDAVPLKTGIVHSNTGPVTDVDQGTMTMDSLLAVRSLARSKGLTNDSMSDSGCDKAIFAYTQLPYAQENLTAIIVKISAYNR